MTRRATETYVPGATYRLTYASSPGQRRQATGRFVGVQHDPIVKNPDTGHLDKYAFHFILTEPVIRDLTTQTEYVIEAPAGEDIHFHIWPEDLLDITRAPHDTENTAHEHPQT